MPNIYFIFFEFIIYIQFAICLRQALPHGTAKILKLLIGAGFGVLLELASIHQLHAYTYGRFLVMIAEVPLCIGVAWGCILYSAMEFSDGSDLPYWLRPILDGLLALNIDLALDTVAIRLGFWDWGQGLKFQYFGVPYANFWAWFWVIFFFSLGYRLFERHPGWMGQWLPAFSGLVIGLIGELSTNALIAFVIPFAFHGLTTAILLIGALMVVVAIYPHFYQQPADTAAFWVPFLSHAYLLVAGLVSGVIVNPPILLFVSLIMFSVALYLHRPTLQSLVPGKVSV